MDTKNLIPFLAMPLLLLAVEIGALLLSLPVQASGIVAFEDPESMANPVIFIAIMLGFTALLLVLIRYDMKKVIAAVIGISIFLTFVYIFMAIVYALAGETDLQPLSSLVLAILSTVLLYKYPEWYVIDALGILIGAGVAAIFGASLEILPVIILLILLAVYDAISVYKTKHMITLAEGVMDLKTPILFVIPKRRDYSFIREGIGKLDERRGAGCLHHRHGRHDHAVDSRGLGQCVLTGVAAGRHDQPPGARCDCRFACRPGRPAVFRDVGKAAGRAAPAEWRDDPGIPGRVGGDGVGGVGPLRKNIRWGVSPHKAGGCPLSGKKAGRRRYSKNVSI